VKSLPHVPTGIAGDRLVQRESVAAGYSVFHFRVSRSREGHKASFEKFLVFFEASMLRVAVKLRSIGLPQILFDRYGFVGSRVFGMSRS
jgi:hypothetical protein